MTNQVATPDQVQRTPKPEQAYRRDLRPFMVGFVILVALFWLPLVGLFKLSLAEDLFSHVILIPFVSLYFLWEHKAAMLADSSAPNRQLALVPLLIGLAAVIPPLVAVFNGWIPHQQQDYLAPLMFGFVSLLAALCLFSFGRTSIRHFTFPLAFMLFSVPLPSAASAGIEHFLQHASASASGLLFNLLDIAFNTPVTRDPPGGTIFILPGFSMNVAPECAGIRSTYVLFITSIVAAQMFLRTRWRRLALVLFVVPLGIVRNAIRIVTIGYLCVHVSPDMIHSWVHKRGGPFFFVLSLIPFTLLLLLLWRNERRKTQPAAAVANK